MNGYNPTFTVKVPSEHADIFIGMFSGKPLRYDVLRWLNSTCGEEAVSKTQLIHTDNTKGWFVDRSKMIQHGFINIVFIDKSKAMLFKLTWL